MTLWSIVWVVAACGGSSNTTIDASRDGSPVDAPPADASAVGTGLGTVTAGAAVTCPTGAPPGSTCKRVTVAGCAGLETEAIDATLAILVPSGNPIGTIVHFSGGGGGSFQVAGAQQYGSAGYRQVFVEWATAWEQTQSLGIKAAGCRPSTILEWIFNEPTLHAASRTQAFCGEGFSGGSGQLGYALAQYGLADYLDYVNELSGPPFARIDLGCDGNAPATATVCGAADTMRLPALLNNWENVKAPDSCGSTTNSAAQIARWMTDSISIGGVYAYPKTRVELFDCTYQATAVTAMAQIYYNQISTAEAGDPTLSSYHCYAQADGCQGESLGAGAAQAVSGMLAGCTPRHQ